MSQTRRHNARRRMQLFVLTTTLFLTGVVLVYAQRTGQLTIFGDVLTQPGELTVSGEIDLAKGAEAGDDATVTLTDESGTWLTLADNAAEGRAVYEIGSPDIVTLQRFVPLPTPPQPAEGTITVQFAGSLDGVAYGRSSTPQQLRTDTDFPEPIDLRALLPEHSRFVRIILTMSRTDPAVQPRFAGFTVNYELATGASSSGQNTVSADPAAAVKLSVNNTTAGSVDAPAPPSSPNSLAATGVGDWIIVGMFALAIGGALLLLRMRNDRHL